MMLQALINFSCVIGAGIGMGVHFESISLGFAVACITYAVMPYKN